ncbi:hypothetical protein BDR26DRAFT_855697 [Obelidium mucronatum]|nr:hypothetical protein BDR26DRAFT_855697 [Obelidium mucronatum]
MAMAITSSAIQTLSKMNYSMGTVSVTTVLFMLHLNVYEIDFTPRTWIRWAAYLDSLSFFVLYLGDIVQDTADCRFLRNIKVACDLLWSFKDAFKIGYIVLQTTMIYRSPRRWPAWWAALGSLILYWTFMSQLYGFSDGSFCFVLPGLEPARIALYGFWIAVEFTCIVLITMKLYIPFFQRRNDAQCLLVGDGESGDLHAIRNAMQLLVILSLTMGITLWTLIYYESLQSSLVLQVRNIVIVFSQMVLVIASERDTQYSKQSNHHHHHHHHHHHQHHQHHHSNPTLNHNHTSQNK